MRIVLGGLAAVLVLLTSASGVAHAACPVPEGVSPQLANVSDEERMKYVADSLEHAGGVANAWNIGWVVGYTAFAAVQLGVGPNLEDEARRKAFIVGGVRTAIGALGSFVLRLPTPAERDRMREQAASNADLCPRLQDAERGLARSARAEAKGKGILKHVGVVGLNLAAALVLGLGFDEWKQGAITGGIGLVVGETMIALQPTRSVRAWERYQSGTLTDPASEVSWMLVPTASPHGAGAAFQLRF